MVLSSSERDDLIHRVEQKLGRGVVRHELIRDAVDRTLGALPPAARGTAIVAATSTPDLASRLRGRLEREGVAIERMAVATEGRFTVATLAVSSESEGAVRSAAAALGARVTWRGA